MGAPRRRNRTEHEPICCLGRRWERQVALVAVTAAAASLEAHWTGRAKTGRPL